MVTQDVKNGRLPIQQEIATVKRQLHTKKIHALK